LSQKAGVNIDTLLYIGKSSNGGRGLFASKKIEYRDCMFRIPFCAQLSPDNLPQEIKSLVGKEVSNVAKLAMVILLEKKLGQHSEWAPYINCLPKIDEMNSTIFWTGDELEMIQKSTLYQETIKKKDLTEKEYLAIKPILDSFPKFFEDVDLEGFMHACALVESRAWGSTSRGMSMIPFADFLNHDGTLKTYLLFDEDKQISEVVSDCSYAPGDEILIRYAKFSNSTLLLDFGFTLPHNTHDQVQVVFEIPHSDPIRSIKTELLCRHITRSIKDVNGFSTSENSFTIKLGIGIYFGKREGNSTSTSSICTRSMLYLCSRA
jgi:histone-lysine N-methyltransferase SETD3